MQILLRTVFIFYFKLNDPIEVIQWLKLLLHKTSMKPGSFSFVSRQNQFKSLKHNVWSYQKDSSNSNNFYLNVKLQQQLFWVMKQRKEIVGWIVLMWDTLASQTRIQWCKYKIHAILKSSWCCKFKSKANLWTLQTRMKYWVQK